MRTLLKKFCKLEDLKTEGFYVYQGLSRDGKRNLKYIGTTTQKPTERFRYHRNHGKPLLFEVVAVCRNAEEMLALEYELIKKLAPPLNKIRTRKQNLNKVLTIEELVLRKGVKEWCQICFKRRVYKESEFCFWCGKIKGGKR